jgi:hypothetical protein
VLGVKRDVSDRWKWMDETYLVKEAYYLLTEGEEGDEECEWDKDVWNNLIPSNMSTLGKFGERL